MRGFGTTNASVVWTRRALAALGVGLGLSACVQIAGIEEPTLGDPNGDGGGATGGAGGDAMTSSSSGGPCTPDTIKTCYSGPIQTANVGNCKTGQQICLADGTNYGPCEGEVVPAFENCVVVGDEDCDTISDIDDGDCVCTVPGAVLACDTGMLGVCAAGMGVCAADGRSITDCMSTTAPSPENCATPEDDDCDGATAVACSGDPNWTTIPVGAAMIPNDDAVFSIAATADGGYVIAGMTDGTIGGDGFSVSAGSIYVAKLNATGNLVWEKKLTSSTFATARGVAVDQNGTIIVVGEFQGSVRLDGTNNNTSASAHADIFMVKLDASGQYLWHKVIGVNNHQVATAVATDAMGNIVMTGVVTNDVINFGGMDFDPDNDDVFIAKFDSNGTHLWSKVHINYGSQKGRRLAVANNGDVVIIGETSDDVNLGGGPITKGGNLDFFVARYGSDGTHMWSKLFGKGGDQLGRGIATTPGGDVLVTGGFSGSVDWQPGTTMYAAAGTTDVYVAKLNGNDGSYIMHAKGNATGLSSALATSVAADAAGNITLFGSFNGSMDFGNQPVTSNPGNYDTFLVKLRANDWSLVWTKPFGKAGHQFGWGLAVLPDGSALAGGGFYTELEVPPNAALPSTGGSDVFAVRTMP